MNQGDPAAVTQSPAASIYLDGLAAGEFRFQRCIKCNSTRHPPTSRCATCGSDHFSVETSALRGTVYSWVIPRRPQIASPPAATDRTVVLIDLDEGVRVLGHWKPDRTRPYIGQRVIGAVALFGDQPLPIFDGVPERSTPTESGRSRE